MPAGLSILGRERTYLATDPALGRILRLPPEGFPAAAASRSYVDAEGRPLPPEAFPSVVAAAERRAVENVEIGVDLESGERVWVNVSAVPSPISDWDTVLALTDVSGRKRAEERLSLGQGKACDDKCREVLADACSRVNAMGAIYETPVYSDGVDRIELDAYLERFLRALHETYAIDPGKLRFETRLEAREIDVRRAVSLGLALLRLLANRLGAASRWREARGGAPSCR